MSSPERRKRNRKEESMLQREQSMIQASHLVVMQHGLHGTTNDFAHFERLFQQYFTQENVFVHCAKSNCQGIFQTYDGVDTGGERLAKEIQEISEKMPHLKKFSLIGHSLGGLYSRYAIGILYENGFFNKIQPMNFLTLATPHYGIRRPQRGSFNFVFNSVSQKMFARTGIQLTLRDVASERAQALASNETYHGNFSTRHHETMVFTDMTGHLRMRMRIVVKKTTTPSKADSMDHFKTYYCKLEDHQLRVYQTAINTSSNPQENNQLKEKESQTQEKMEHRGKDKTYVCQWDLRQMDVRLIVPIDPQDLNEDASVPENEQGKSRNATSLVLLPKSGGPIECEIEMIEEEREDQWKWLVALSNSCFGMLCGNEDNNIQVFEQNQRQQVEPSGKEGVPPPPSSPPLLSCLTKGQFIQGLMLFECRKLYSNVFFDFQVPYSCSSIRAFNPYRTDSTKWQTCPTYKSITTCSVWSAPLIRNTIPQPIIKRSTFKPSPSFIRAESFSHSTGSSKPFFLRLKSSDDGIDHAPSAPNASVSSSLFGRLARYNTFGDLFSTTKESPLSLTTTSRTMNNTRPRSSDDLTKRPEPFVDDAINVVLDRPEEAFRTHPQRDLLRSMLISLQSIGWERVDVMFDNVLAHEKIIAKRANPTKPHEWGLDVAHHVIDTFHP